MPKNLAYELTDMCFQYTGQPVLNIKHGQIEAGENIAVLGANGSGKTTLFNILALLQQADSGRLSFFNEEITESNLKQRRKTIGYVQQKPYLFNLTVRENIELPLKLRAVEKQQRSIRCQKVMARLLIEDLAQRRAHTLSGGEIQKVALARALILEPEILILDEPFTHLDKQAVDFLESLFLEIKGDKNISLIFSLHDHLKAHYLADQVFTMLDGHLLSSSTMNLFSGEVNQTDNVFNTGKIGIVIPQNIEAGQHLAVDSKQLVLSKERLSSSMRNQFQGRVIAMTELEGQVRVSVDAGEIFQAIITHGALRDLAIHMGDEVWVSFKSSSLSLF